MTRPSCCGPTAGQRGLGTTACIHPGAVGTQEDGGWIWERGQGCPQWVRSAHVHSLPVLASHTTAQDGCPVLWPLPGTLDAVSVPAARRD